MLRIVKILTFILRHPLNERQRFQAMMRFVRWQLASRFYRAAVVIPFVGGTRLLTARGMTGATGNLYCGLHEFDDMAFVLHALRSDDVFVDVGANVGSYTILAAGAVGSRCIAIEPIPKAFEVLCDNIRLNDLTNRVIAKNIGLGAISGTLSFTDNLDTTNHVVSAHESLKNSLPIAIETLDSALSGVSATIVKIDVEGFETNVVNGANETLRSVDTLAVLMELNGSGARYGFDEATLHQRMLNFGFVVARYDGRTRELLETRQYHGKGNTLYVRGLAQLQARVRSAPRYSVHGALV